MTHARHAIDETPASTRRVAARDSRRKVVVLVVAGLVLTAGVVLLVVNTGSSPDGQVVRMAPVPMTEAQTAQEKAASSRPKPTGQQVPTTGRPGMPGSETPQSP
jgi:flagellar basal body-associated protein FliL